MVKWTLDNSIDNLMISNKIFDDDEIVIRKIETGKIVWEGKAKQAIIYEEKK